jgi:hypothetical protein
MRGDGVKERRDKHNTLLVLNFLLSIPQARQLVNGKNALQRNRNSGEEDSHSSYRWYYYIRKDARGGRDLLLK